MFFILGSLGFCLKSALIKLIVKFFCLQEVKNSIGRCRLQCKLSFPVPFDVSGEKNSQTYRINEATSPKSIHSTLRNAFGKNFFALAF